MFDVLGDFCKEFSKIFCMICYSVVKSTDRDIIRYLYLKKSPVRFEHYWADSYSIMYLICMTGDWWHDRWLVIVFMSSTDTSMIGFNDHRCMLFTELLHRNTQHKTNLLGGF